MRKLSTLLVLLCLGLVATFFINATTNDFEKEIGGKHQIKGVKVQKNDLSSAEIEFELARGSKNKVKSSVKVLTANDPIYSGESQVIDETLGKYRVALTFTDVRLQKKLINELGLKKNSFGKKGQNLLETVKIAYPPDDALMVIYLGTDTEPQLSVDEHEDKIVVKLAKKQ